MYGIQDSSKASQSTLVRPVNPDAFVRGYQVRQPNPGEFAVPTPPHSVVRPSRAHAPSSSPEFAKPLNPHYMTESGLRAPLAKHAQSPLAAQPANAGSEEANVQKLVKLLRSFIVLCYKQFPQNVERMSTLIRQVIDCVITPMDFHQELGSVVGKSPQAHMRSFLEDNLPALRRHLNEKRLSLDSIFNPVTNKDSALPTLSRGSSTPVQSSPLVNSTPNGHVSASAPIYEQLRVETPGRPPSQPTLQLPQTSSLRENQASKPSETPSASAISSQSQERVVFKDVNDSSSTIDQKFLSRQGFTSMVQQLMPECLAFEEEAFSMISDKVESKVRGILVKMIDNAAIRLYPYRTDPNYTLVNDPRKQLEIAERYYARQQRAKDYKPLPIESSEKSRREQDDVVNRKANEAAHAALGKKRKAPVRQQAPPATLNNSVLRARVKYLSMRDVYLAFTNDRFARRMPNLFLPLVYFENYRQARALETERVKNDAESRSHAT